MKNRPIVVTGASGQLGTAFVKLLGERCVGLTRRDLDLVSPSSIGPVFEGITPGLVINCAAYTAVDQAEEDAETAYVVNADAVAAMARWCSTAESRLLTFSTDYVFDGTKPDPYVESDPTAPINVYGASKRAGERAALEAYPEALVVRTSWVLSGTHPNFAATMLRMARERELSVVDDQKGHPTLVDDLAVAALAAVDAGVTGVLHLTNQGVVTWFELARKVVEMAGLDPDVITPCTTADYPRPAPRPANSVLESERLADSGLEPMPHFDAGLRRAVAQLEARR